MRKVFSEAQEVPAQKQPSSPTIESRFNLTPTFSPSRFNIQTKRPEAILRRQQLLGNQNTHRHLQRQAATVQRTMYLGDADLNIYQDSDKPADEYAFVHKGQNNAFYIKYEAVDKIQKNAKLLHVKTHNSPRDFNSMIDDAFIMKNKFAQELRDIMGDVHIQDDNDGGKVKPVGVSGATWAQIVLNILDRGAMYLNVGGGSRLPKAGGKLFVCGQTREEALGRIGVNNLAGYENVAAVDMRSDPRRFELMLQELSSNPENKPFVFIGKSLQESVIYISGVEQSRPKNSRVTLKGSNYADDLSDLPVPLKGTIDNSFQGLTKPKTDSGWVLGTQLVTIGREDGQAAQMDKWNALGAAAYANQYLGKNYDLSQSWEWLHIQGAQIGGQTVGGNLVPGLYATNSFMIPYESMIKDWATADPTRFEARFESESDSNNVFANKIRLSIAARGHKQLGDLPPRVLVEFNPLTGRLIDKLANEIMKRNIDKDVRV